MPEEQRNPAEEYIRLSSEAKKHIDTTHFNIREAYNKAEASTIGEDSLVSLESLVNQSGRDNFKQAFFDSFNPKVFDYFGATKNDIFRQDRLWLAYAGFTKTQLDQLVEGVKDRMSYDNFFQFVGPRFRPIMEMINDSPMSALKATDTQTVMDYLASKNALDPARIDVAKLGVPDLAVLLETYKEHGIITPNFLKEQAYYVKPQD